jgi:hypothetical protein
MPYGRHGTRTALRDGVDVDGGGFNLGASLKGQGGWSSARTISGVLAATDASPLSWRAIGPGEGERVQYPYAVISARTGATAGLTNLEDRGLSCIVSQGVDPAGAVGAIR